MRAQSHQAYSKDLRDIFLRQRLTDTAYQATPHCGVNPRFEAVPPIRATLFAALLADARCLPLVVLPCALAGQHAVGIADLGRVGVESDQRLALLPRLSGYQQRLYGNPPALALVHSIRDLLLFADVPEVNFEVDEDAEVGGDVENAGLVSEPP